MDTPIASENTKIRFLYKNKSLYRNIIVQYMSFMQNYIIYLNRLDRLSPIGSCHPNRVAVAKPYTTRNATSNKFKRILPDESDFLFLVKIIQKLGNFFVRRVHSIDRVCNPPYNANIEEENRCRF